MSSVEDNENIEKAFNDILKEEYQENWELIAVPQKIVALFCYTIPALLMIGSSSYHDQNVLAVLFFSVVIGTGFYSYYRYNAALRAFFSNDKPSDAVIHQVRERSKYDTDTAVDTNKLTPEEESDWGLIVTQLEQSMEMDDESDEMNVSTLFDRAETEPTTLHPKKIGWFQRLFGRAK